MENRSMDRYPFDSDHCCNLLSGLAGVFAAGVRFEQERMVEIHVLASTERSPKQIVRDIQSALYAAYGLEVDHRIISVAQLPENPFDMPAASKPSPVVTTCDVRVMFTGIDMHRRDGVCEASVYLSLDGKMFTGTARGRDTRTQQPRITALATLDAVHTMLGREFYDLLEVRQVTVGDTVIFITVVEYMDTYTGLPMTLTGAAVQRDGVDASIVRSTLDALNRSIGKLYRMS